MDERQLTPRYFQFFIRFLRPFPDFDFAFIGPVRRKAVTLLALAPGARVLDVGCGPGGSLPYLREAVGASGEVVGVEISPAVAGHAEQRIARQEWRNVRVLVAPAQTVALGGLFDGLLMFAAPDVYASREALDNLLPHLKPKARVVLFGAKTSRRRTGWLLNGALRAVFRRFSFASTPVPTEAPWRLLAPSLESLQVDEYFFGWMFIASGTLAAPQR